MQADIPSNLEDILATAHLDHIALAVHSIEDATGLYEALGFEFSDYEEVQSQGVRVKFGHVDSRARIEFLEPLGAEGPVAKFLQKRGAGFHHLCFFVKDLAATMDRLKEREVKFITERPFTGAGGKQVIFIHPKSANGVLIELSSEGVDS